MRSNTRSRRGYVSARIKPALFIAIIFTAALALTGDLGRLIPSVFAIDRGTGSVSLTTIGAAATQNFNTLSNTAGSTTNEALPTGWYITESGGGARDNDQYAVDTGGSNTGDTFSYGAAGNTDRALGSLQSGTLISTYGAQFTNNTGATITSLDIAYTGEQWRIGNTAAARDDRLDFQISTNATNLCGPDSGTCVGTYTDVNALDFTNPVKTAAAAAALDGNNAANRTAISTTISSLSIPNGATFWIRWNDLNSSGADDGLAVDDFSITPQGGPPVDNPPTVLSTSPADNAVNVSESSNITVTFNEPVTVTASSFTISCTTSGAHPFTLSGGPTAYTLDPTTNFTPGEVCTVTVVAAQVADQDGTPNNMAADYVFDFTVINLSPVAIHDIQGSGATSPLAGQTVSTSGIVTLLRTGANTGGAAASSFFMQAPDAAADADPNTSEGILVFTSTVPAVSVGDSVTVVGTVVEFNGMTEISPVTSISVNSTGNTLPTPVTLTTTILDPTAPPTQPQLEKYEGMRLSAAALRTVAPNDNFYDVDTVLNTVARPFREPGVEISNTVPPDPTSGTVDPNIARWDENPERLKVDTNGRAGAPNVGYTSNVVFTNVAGPLDFAFGEYRFILDAAPAASANMSAVPVPVPSATEFTVAGYNIENFTAGNTTQKVKASRAIRDVMRFPDIIGHIEILDLATLQSLATQVNNDAVAAGQPNPNYQAQLIPAPAGGTQNVGFLVKTSRVAIDGLTQERAAETFVNPVNGQTETLHDRPPLVLRARVNPTGENLPVIAVVNHLRSFIDIELVTGEGVRVREKRKKQAESLAGLLQELQVNNPTTLVISVGDYNAFQFSSGYDDSMSVIKGNPTPDDQIVVDQSPDLVNPDYYNLMEDVAAEQRYSFIFEGTPQLLDHVIVNTVARARSTRTTVAHSNADFPENPPSLYASNTAIPERSSDHDMPVAYFSLVPLVETGDLIISELRTSGPAGPDDDFVEVYNATNADITVLAADGSAGWGLYKTGAACTDSPVLIGTIPNGTLIPARGHYLFVGTGYSLASYAAGDLTLTANIEDDRNVGLFTTANAANVATGTRLDAVGFFDGVNGFGGNCDLLREDAPLLAAQGSASQYSFVRNLTTGQPLDTNRNVDDFIIVSTTPSVMVGFTANPRLGAPGPENLTSPINRASIKASLFNFTQPSTASPNRVRNLTPYIDLLTPSSPNGTIPATDPYTQGTLSIQRRFTNQSGQPVTRLRFRVVDVTTLNSPLTTAPTQADVRVLSSNGSVTSTGGVPVATVEGLTLEQPPTQPRGGGWNSTVAAGSISMATPLAAGATIDVQFLLGVASSGNFRFFVIVEADLTAPQAALKPAGRGAAGRAGKR